MDYISKQAFRNKSIANFLDTGEFLQINESAIEIEPYENDTISEATDALNFCDEFCTDIIDDEIVKIESAFALVDIVLDREEINSLNESYNFLIKDMESGFPLLENTQNTSDSILHRLVELIKRAIRVCATAIVNIFRSIKLHLTKFENYVKKNKDRLDKTQKALASGKSNKVERNVYYEINLPNLNIVDTVVDQLMKETRLFTSSNDYATALNNFKNRNYDSLDNIYKIATQKLMGASTKNVVPGDIKKFIRDKLAESHGKTTSEAVTTQEFTNRIKLLGKIDQQLRSLSKIFSTTKSNSIIVELDKMCDSINKLAKKSSDETAKEYFRAKYNVVNQLQRVFFDYHSVIYKVLVDCAKDNINALNLIMNNTIDSSTNNESATVLDGKFIGPNALYNAILYESSGDIAETPEELQELKKSDIKDFDTSDLKCDIDSDTKKTIEDNDLKPVYLDDDAKEVYFLSTKDNSVWKYDQDDKEIECHDTLDSSNSSNIGSKILDSINKDDDSDDKDESSEDDAKSSEDTEASEQKSDNKESDKDDSNEDDKSEKNDSEEKSDDDEKDSDDESKDKDDKDKDKEESSDDKSDDDEDDEDSDDDD